MQLIPFIGLAVTTAAVFCVGFFAIFQLWIGEEIVPQSPDWSAKKTR